MFPRGLDPLVGDNAYRLIAFVVLFLVSLHNCSVSSVGNRSDLHVWDPHRRVQTCNLLPRLDDEPNSRRERSISCYSIATQGVRLSNGQARSFWCNGGYHENF
jgi:hypothetical protein